MPRKSPKIETPPVPAAGKDVRVLVVEDERHLAESVARRLHEEGYVVDVTHDGEEASRMGCSKRYHLIILDLLLPGKDGLQVLRELRRNRVTSLVLVLSARSAIEDRVEGLKLGADDYLSKPFAFAELMARVETLLRRQGVEQTTILRVADLELDIETRNVRRASKSIH